MYRSGTNGRKTSSAEMKTNGEGAAVEVDGRDCWNASNSSMAAYTESAVSYVLQL